MARGVNGAQHTYNVSEFAEVMGVSVKHVQRLIRKGELDHLILRLGDRTVFPKVRVHRLLEGVDSHKPTGQDAA